jgi:hypothetical protein
MPTSFSSFSGQYCKNARRQWMSIKHQGTSHDGGHGGKASRRAQDGGSVSPDGGGLTSGSGSGAAARSSPGGSGGAGGSGAQPLQEFRRTIPCAMDVIGNTLGVPSTHPCRSCLPRGRVPVDITAAPIALSVGSRLVFRCQAFYQMVLGIRLPGEATRSRSRPQSRPGSRFFRIPLISLRLDRLKQVSPERQNWKISSGDSPRHLQGHDRAGGGQGFFPQRREDPFPG